MCCVLHPHTPTLRYVPVLCRDPKRRLHVSISGAKHPDAILHAPIIPESGHSSNLESVEMILIQFNQWGISSSIDSPLPTPYFDQQTIPSTIGNQGFSFPNAQNKMQVSAPECRPLYASHRRSFNSTNSPNFQPFKKFIALN